MSKRGLPIEERFWSKVEKTEACWDWNGYRDRHGYGMIPINSKPYRAHRFSYELVNGEIPSGLVIDHTCHRPSCVRPEHLRAVTHKQNMENQYGGPRSTKSGVRGVYWQDRARPWRVQVFANGKYHYGGDYDTVPEAEEAAVSLRNRLFTHNDADRRET